MTDPLLFRLRCNTARNKIIVIGSGSPLLTYMKYNDTDIVKFLSESNHIEDVWDDDSLQQAIYAWDYLEKEKVLTPHVVLKTHKILMLHQPLMPDERGYFRRVAVYIGGRQGRPWYAIPELMDIWCKRANTATRGSQIKADHVAYEEIHPFVDGNGRTGRMFMNWQRMKAGLPIKIIYEAEKYKYYKWFE